MKELQESYSDIDYFDILSLSGTFSPIKDKTGKQFVIIIDEWDVFNGNSSDKESTNSIFIK